MFGETTVHNFPPNNWEKFFVSSKSINVTWTDGKQWNSVSLGQIKPYESIKISYDDVKSIVPDATLPLLSLTEEIPNEKISNLNYQNSLGTTWPMWRATIGIGKDNSITSYQGELIPFPNTGSMLSFAPFINNPAEIILLILINIEIEPEIREGLIEIFSYKTKEKKLSKKISNNNVSIIDISKIIFDNDDMLVLKSTELSSIPLIFSASNNYTNLSLEHTHPPAALSILGSRFLVQRDIKKKWFQLLK